MPTHALRDLQAAARRYAQLVNAKAEPRWVFVLNESREIIFKVMLDEHCECPEPAAVIPSKAVAPGWNFDGGLVQFDGLIVALAGRKAELLKILASRPEPMTAREIRDCWDKHMDEGTVRWQIGELRKVLKELFPGLDEPIITTDAGYSLQVR